MDSMLSKALREFTTGPLNQLIVNLGGKDATEWEAELKKFLRKETCWEKPIFQTWKTIKLGTLKTVDEIREVLKQNAHNIGDWANDILGKPAFTLAQTEEEIHLVTATVAELGFKDGATNQQIWDRIVELGYELCPAEVGPQLRLQYTDQPKGEWLVIAMKPITASDGRRRVFHVERLDGGDSWLYGDFGGPSIFWGADYRFVFASRK